MTTGFVVWLTGMSGTGKTTLVNYLAPRLRQVGKNTEVLDATPLTAEFWGSIGDTKEDRVTVIRRIGMLAQMLGRNNVAVLVAAVSPYKASREENRRGIEGYVEVYVDCPTDKLIERDSTGRYKKALGGEIPNFIGITEPYEPPTAPEVTIRSDTETLEEGGRKVLQSLLDLGYISGEEMRTILGEKRRTGGKKSPRGKSKPAAKGARKARPTARAARVAKAAKKVKKSAAKRKSR